MLMGKVEIVTEMLRREIANMSLSFGKGGDCNGNATQGNVQYHLWERWRLFGAGKKLRNYIGGFPLYSRVLMNLVAPEIANLTLLPHVDQEITPITGILTTANESCRVDDIQATL